MIATEKSRILRAWCDSAAGNTSFQKRASRKNCSTWSAEVASLIRTVL